MTEGRAAVPSKTDLRQEQTELAPFRDLPDQIIVKSLPATLRHTEDLFIPLSVNGKPADFFLDTGAALSVVGEAEARRLGLTLHETEGNIGTSTGRQTRFRTAVARELTVGNIHFQNVSFGVFRDDQPPWSQLPLGKRGLLGIPVLRAFRTLRWTRDGMVEICARPGRRDTRPPNLCFMDDHLVTEVDCQGRKLLATLDTGAVSTDLYAAFAKEFADLLSRSGKKGSTEVKGVGGAESFESISLPELKLRLGGLDTRLRPANVLLKQIGPEYCVGNVGLDLLKQARAFRLDFDAMTLELEANVSTSSNHSHRVRSAT
jgi:predicted aspartyl protease